MRNPPSASRMAPNQKREPTVGSPLSGGPGNAKSFCVPCSMKIRAVTIRRTASAVGA